MQWVDDTPALLIFTQPGFRNIIYFIPQDDRPLYPYKILRTKILNNPFDDIVPRESIKKEKSSKKEKNTPVATKYNISIKAQK